MSSRNFFYGEDIIMAPAAGTAIHRLANHMRASDIWEEVVPGMADITIKYDPGKLSAEEAKRNFEEQLRSGEQADDPIRLPPPVRLTISCDNESAPDAAMLCDAVGIAVDDLARWLSRRRYHVAMMGFQPGFVYLSDFDGSDLPAIARLETPRQRVRAGSIGFLGGKACIYALDGPGGWPIIGRVREKLFDPDNIENPVLLTPGQAIGFIDGD